MQTFMNKVQDVNLKMKKRYWVFPRKLEENKNYVTILFFDLVFNKKRKQSRPNTCSNEKGSNTWKENSQQQLILS